VKELVSRLSQRLSNQYFKSVSKVFAIRNLRVGKGIEYKDPNQWVSARKNVANRGDRQLIAINSKRAGGRYTERRIYVYTPGSRSHSQALRIAPGRNPAEG
jgi:hypothetical protein